MAATPEPSTRDALIAVMEQLAAMLDPVPDGPIPPQVRQALAAPLRQARALAAELDSEVGSASAYLMTLDAIEQRIAGTGPG